MDEQNGDKYLVLEKKNQIFRLKGFLWKVFSFDNEKIVRSSENADTFESLIKVSKKTSSCSEIVSVIPMSTIYEISYYTGGEKENSFYVKYLSAKRKKEISITLLEDGLKSSICESLASMNKLKRKKIPSKIRIFLGYFYLFVIFGIVYLTYSTYQYAKNTHEVYDYDSLAHKAKILMLFINKIADFVGPIGVLILGSVIGLMTSFNFYKNYKKPIFLICFNKNLAQQNKDTKSESCSKHDQPYFQVRGRRYKGFFDFVGTSNYKGK